MKNPEEKQREYSERLIALLQEALADGVVLSTVEYKGPPSTMALPDSWKGTCYIRNVQAINGVIHPYLETAPAVRAEIVMMVKDGKSVHYIPESTS